MPKIMPSRAVAVLAALHLAACAAPPREMAGPVPLSWRACEGNWRPLTHEFFLERERTNG